MAAIYLAGPEVFLANALEIGQAKQALCEHYAFDGLFPLDADFAQGGGAALSTRIYDANMDAIARSDAVIANLTPFRGVSADVGTVFEVAHALASRKPVFAYSNVVDPLRDRVAAVFGALPRTSGPFEFAEDGMMIEDFGLADNLMIVEAIRAQGWDLVVRAAPADRMFTDLAAFEDCLRRAKAVLPDH